MEAALADHLVHVFLIPTGEKWSPLSFFRTTLFFSEPCCFESESYSYESTKQLNDCYAYEFISLSV